MKKRGKYHSVTETHGTMFKTVKNDKLYSPKDKNWPLNDAKPETNELEHREQREGKLVSLARADTLSSCQLRGKG